MTLDFTDYTTIPTSTQTALENYITNRWGPGGFLTAVLENDLCGAFGRADSHNLAELANIVRFIYNRIPAEAWGSRDKVSKWLAR